MKVKAEVEQTVVEEVEFDLDDAALLDYINNGGEHSYDDLIEAQANLPLDTFKYIVREFIEYEVVNDNPRLIGNRRWPLGDTETKVERVMIQ